MKYEIRFLILFWVFMSLNSEAVPCNLPTPEQAEKLVEAVFKDLPHSIDVTLYRESIEPTMSEQKITKMFEETFTKMYGPKDKLSELERERFDREVRWNVERTLKTQQAGSKLKQRIIISNGLQRIDQVSAQPSMVLLKGTPYESSVAEVALGPNTPYEMTIVDLGENKQNDYTSFVYYHKMMTAQKSQAKKWAKSNIIDLTSFPMRGLRIFLGREEETSSGKVFIPDNDKIDKLIDTGKIGAMTLCINPDPNTPAINDRIELKNEYGQDEVVLICDRNNYSQVYYAEIRLPTIGKPIRISECSHFDSNGFPRQIKVTEYKSDGSFKKKESYEIVDVKLNPMISEKIFSFNPPEEYEIVEIDPNGKSSIIREKGGIESAMRTLLKAQKEKDISTLMDLLDNKIWQIRLRSLQVLAHLLAEDHEALKETSLILKNDNNPKVRAEAQKILNRIDRLESTKSQDSPN